MPALPVVGLWPKTPLKKAGMRMLPPMSEPTPMTEQAAARTLPSPPAWEKIQQKTHRLIVQITQQSRKTSRWLLPFAHRWGGSHSGFSDVWGPAGERGPKELPCQNATPALLFAGRVRPSEPQ